MDKNNFFLGIGPPKTGTTWLYKVLDQHPKIKLPLVKEIRYFWSMENLGKSNILNNLFDKHWHYEFKRKNSLPVLKGSLKQLLRFKKINIENSHWHFKYFFGSQNDKWYESLFTNNGLSGDITPKYCELSESSILKIKELVPNAKIIISLRDPIDREWSRVKMNLLRRRNKKSIEELDEKSIIQHFNDQAQHLSNDYVKLIETWIKYFDKDQVLIFYYDELKQNPQLLMDRICHFLDIETFELNNPKKKYNEGIIQEIPEKYRRILVDMNYGFIENLSIKYPSKYSSEWLEKHKQYTTINKANA